MGQVASYYTYNLIITQENEKGLRIVFCMIGFSTLVLLFLNIKKHKKNARCDTGI